MGVCTMPKKIQPIRIQESPCVFDGITSNLPIMRRAYVALIVLATVFSMAWYKIVIQRRLVVYHGISHLSLVFSWYTRSPEGWYVYWEKIQVTRGMFHGIPLESVPQLGYIFVYSLCRYMKRGSYPTAWGLLNTSSYRSNLENLTTLSI